jgi:DNA ligase-1
MTDIRIPLTYPSLHREYPPLFGLDKVGKTRIWVASVFASDDHARGMYVVQHGTYNGKLQIDTREFVEGKNLGKKNATSGLTQCLQEIEKKRNDKIEKEGYSETRPVAPFPGGVSDMSGGSGSASPPTEAPSAPPIRKVFPMLANKFEPGSTKKSSSMAFPCFVQPKLDGLRCVVFQTADGDIVFQSRTGGLFKTLNHLVGALQAIFARNRVLVLDGELYTDQLPFEELAGLIKKKTLSAADAERVRHVQYHVYDTVLPDMPYSERWKILQTAIEPPLAASAAGNGVQLVPTFTAAGLSEFRGYFQQFAADGYEGIMLRDPAGFYVENYRSSGLLKYKEFQEAEYPIVGFHEGLGRDAGTVIWLCRTPEGREFKVRPKGSLAFRRQLFQQATQYLGHALTVIFQELSDAGVPRFPVGKAIRTDY